MRARKQLGTPGDEDFSDRSLNILNYVQHIFPGARNEKRFGKDTIRKK